MLVDLETERVMADTVVETDPSGSLQSAAWSPTGETLAVGSTTGGFHILDGSRLEPAAPRRLLTGGPVADIEVSPDGRIAATLEGADGDVSLWDATTWQPYVQGVLHDQGVGFLRFDPQSADLVVPFNLGVRARVETDPSSWIDAACEAANRQLTADEAAVIGTDPSTDGPCPAP
jgi:WD40 repeat protein